MHAVNAPWVFPSDMRGRFSPGAIPGRPGFSGGAGATRGPRERGPPASPHATPFSAGTAPGFSPDVMSAPRRPGGPGPRRASFPTRLPPPGLRGCPACHHGVARGHPPLLHLRGPPKTPPGPAGGGGALRPPTMAPPGPPTRPRGRQPRLPGGSGPNPPKPPGAGPRAPGSGGGVGEPPRGFRGPPHGGGAPPPFPRRPRGPARPPYLHRVCQRGRAPKTGVSKPLQPQGKRGGLNGLYNGFSQSGGMIQR